MLHGKQLIAGNRTASTESTFRSINPATAEAFGEKFYEGSEEDVDRAIRAADAVFDEFRGRTAEERADLLESIADEILALGDDLLERAHLETGLPMGRLKGERGRAVNQTRLFASIVREGSWIGARIDRGNPDRTPAPKPDVRSMNQPIGPVAVFGASNFPLAIGVAGTDTVAALSSGCPVVVKAHPAHPGTCELLAEAIQQALAKNDMPAGAFSMVHGRSNEVGLALVKHPATRAVAFTGGLRGGRALFDAAAARPIPIPVYAEMGSTNPVFLLPGALEKRADEIAKGYLGSVNLGVGQFCTNPGVVLGLKGEALDRFVDVSAETAGGIEPATMLHPGISKAFYEGVERIRDTGGVDLAGEQNIPGDPQKTQATCTIFTTDMATLQSNEHLMDEVFGPTSLVVNCSSIDEMKAFAEDLDGHLSATIHGTDEDLIEHASLVRILERKAGRLIFNGFPTGIEVCAAMHHGGPYPATTDSHFTSIGSAAINRFVHPVCYQNFPDAALPLELQNANPRGIWRLVDGELSRGGV